jgi:hypothetical protein
MPTDKFKIVKIGYVYAAKDVWKKYESAIDLVGWRKSVILTQLIQTYGKVNLKYYQRAAELDAAARGYDGHKGDHYCDLSSWAELRPYQRARPDYGASPLTFIAPVDTRTSPRKAFGQFRCSAQNSAVLRLAVIAEQSNVQIVMTKIMSWYYDHYWDLYLPQMASEKQQTLSPDFDPFPKN